MGHEVFFFIYKRSQKLLDIGNFASVCGTYRLNPNISKCITWMTATSCDSKGLYWYMSEQL